MKKPELLAPAGNLEKLKFAVAYGADAVYFGTQFGSLRSYAGNFDDADAKAGLDYLHARGKKGYVTLNIYPFSDEYARLRETALQMDSFGADAFIVADLGVFTKLKNLNLRAPLHISTQANTVSAPAALAWADLGAARVNLARELALEQIREIAARCADRVQTEVFIHGAVCMSISGRCAVSDYMTGHRANRGECKHPCRYRYALVEETRPGRYYPVFEDERGLYLFNSRDLALFEYLPALCGAGVDSLKIEGRMKSVHYVAAVTAFYRRILDRGPCPPDQALDILSRVSSRGCTAGFIKGSFTPDDYAFDTSATSASALFVGNVLAPDPAGRTLLEVRNKIRAGDTLEVLRPDGTLDTIQMPPVLHTADGQTAPEVNNSRFLLLDTPLPEFTILRRLHTAQ